MRTLGTKSEIEALPDWARAFLDEAWAPADAAGQRAARRDFAGSTAVLYRVSIEVSAALQDPQRADPQFRLSATPAGPHVGFLPFWRDRDAEIAYNLAFAWQKAESLAECSVCGSTIVPDRGRIALTCSAACRMALHRQKKGAA